MFRSSNPVASMSCFEHLLTWWWWISVQIKEIFNQELKIWISHKTFRHLIISQGRNEVKNMFWSSNPVASMSRFKHLLTCRWWLSAQTKEISIQALKIWFQGRNKIKNMFRSSNPVASMSRFEHLPACRWWLSAQIKEISAAWSASFRRPVELNKLFWRAVKAVAVVVAEETSCRRITWWRRESRS